MDDLFADGNYVRLRSRVHGTYLHANDDGVGVSLLPRSGVSSGGAPGALAGVWRVHRVERDGIDYVLLHGAAYGRYLALSPDEPAPPGCVGHRAVQRGYDDPEQDAVMWRPEVVPEDAAGHVRMRHLLNGLLRANGRFRVWNNGVSVDQYQGNPSTMRQWMVEVVPPMPQGAVPILPIPLECGCPSSLFWWRAAPEGPRRRTIRHLLSDQPLDFGPANNDVLSFPFYGRSVYNLRVQVGIRANQGDVFTTIMCVQAGLYGRLTPLITNLPHIDETVHIVVYRVGTPAAAALVYPNVDA